MRTKIEVIIRYHISEVNKKMSENVGKVDQAIRLISGSVLIGSLTFNAIPAPPTIVGVIGIYLVMSGYSGTCLIYSLLNLNTRQGETDSLISEALY